MFVNHVESPWAWHLQFRISEHYFSFLELPRWCSGKESTCQCPCKRQDFDPWVGKIPWSRKWQPTPVFLPGKSHEQWRLASYSLRGHRESDTTEQLSTDACIVGRDQQPRPIFLLSELIYVLIADTLWLTELSDSKVKNNKMICGNGTDT